MNRTCLMSEGASFGKQRQIPLGIAVAIGLAMVALNTAQAQNWVTVTGPLTFSLTATVQNTNTTDNGTTYVEPKPTTVKVTNNDIIDWLAADGLITSSSGAELCYTSNGNGLNIISVVQGGVTNDISSVLSVGHGTNICQDCNNYVRTVEFSDNPDGAFSETEQEILTFTYDDTGAGPATLSSA